MQPPESAAAPLKGMPGPDDPASALDDPHAAEINRLRGYLAARFPSEFEATLAAGRPRTVDLATALLDRLALHPGTDVSPCPVTHCNRPAGHIDDHAAS